MKRDQKSSKEYPKAEEVSKEGDSSQDCDSFLCEVDAAHWIMERFPECPGQNWSILSKPRSWTVGAGTPELKGFCSDASRFRLAGRTLLAGVTCWAATWGSCCWTGWAASWILAGLTRKLPGSHLREVLNSGHPQNPAESSRGDVPVNLQVCV